MRRASEWVQGDDRWLEASIDASFQEFFREECQNDGVLDADELEA